MSDPIAKQLICAVLQSQAESLAARAYPTDAIIARMAVYNADDGIVLRWLIQSDPAWPLDLDGTITARVTARQGLKGTIRLDMTMVLETERGDMVLPSPTIQDALVIYPDGEVVSSGGPVIVYRSESAR